MRLATLTLLSLTIALLASTAASHEADLMPENPQTAPLSPMLFMPPTPVPIETSMVIEGVAQALPEVAPPAPVAEYKESEQIVAASATPELTGPPAPPVRPAPVQVGIAGEKISVAVEDPFDASSVAYDLTMTWMKSEEWQKKVAALRTLFKDWEKINGGDMGQYLNDRFVIVALSAGSGKVDSLKNGFVWLAYYKEFNQKVPSVVSKVLRDHKSSLELLFKDFTWERASQYVRNKEWRRDYEKQ